MKIKGLRKFCVNFLYLFQEIDRNISSPALLGLLGLRMSYVNTEEAEIIKTNFDRENKGRHYHKEYSEVSMFSLYRTLHDVCTKMRTFEG